jgi:hypothetical protein
MYPNQVQLHALNPKPWIMLNIIISSKKNDEENYLQPPQYRLEQALSQG